MSSARDEILARIRSALGRERVNRRARELLERRMSTPPLHGQPPVDPDLVGSLETKLTAVQGEFQLIRDDQLMAAIGARLDAHGVGRVLVAAPALKNLPWPSDWDVTFGATRGDDRLSVTPCFAAVAETGSVVLVSSPESPTSLNFLPEFHIVLVRPDHLVRHVEDVWTKLRAAGISPRTVNFITGPSKTADVEQTIQYGAHGPRALDVIFIQDTASNHDGS